MIQHRRFTAFLPAVALTVAACGGIGFSSVAAADDPPPASTAPGNEAGGRHHNPAFAACKKQADDQKLEPGDARRDFIKGCIKSAKGSVPATP